MQPKEMALDTYSLGDHFEEYITYMCIHINILHTYIILITYYVLNVCIHIFLYITFLFRNTARIKNAETPQALGNGKVTVQGWV